MAKKKGENDQLHLELEGIEVKIKRVNPNGIRPLHVNDMLVSHSNSEFFLTFSQIIPPGVLTEEEAMAIKDIEAVAQAQVVMSAEHFEKVVATLNRNYESYKAQMKALEDE